MFDLLGKNAFLDKSRKMYQNGKWHGSFTRQNTDERRVVPTNGVTNLSINANLADVRISVIPDASDEIVAHLYGEAISEGDVSLKVYLDKDEQKVDIRFQFDGSFYHGKHTLDVCIPDKRFSSVEITTTQGNVILGEGSSEILRVSSENGRISSDWNYQRGEIVTSNSDIIVSSKKIPKSLSVMSRSGDVFITFPEEVGFAMNPESRAYRLKKTSRTSQKPAVELFVSTSGSVRVS